MAGYLAKYLTKATEEFGLLRQVVSAAHAASTGTTNHAVRLIAASEHLAANGGDACARLEACLATLGYRGHPVTESRRYSVTFGALRRARPRFRRRPPGLDPCADVRELPADDNPDAETVRLRVINDWAYAGRGYLDLDRAAQATFSAAPARDRHARRRQPTPHRTEEQ